MLHIITNVLMCTCVLLTHNVCACVTCYKNTVNCYFLMHLCYVICNFLMCMYVCYICATCCNSWNKMLQRVLKMLEYDQNYWNLVLLHIKFHENSYIIFFLSWQFIKQLFFLFIMIDQSCMSNFYQKCALKYCHHKFTKKVF